MASTAATQKCARCGAPFRCGARAGDSTCWCAGMSALPLERLRADESCLCPACLAAEIARVADPD
nr:cysteine-rich CWC family protein [Caballeronia hypogeia]